MKKTFVDFDKQVYVTFTNKCNWNCHYCDFPDMDSREYDLDEKLEMLKVIPSNVEVCLEGGEIGLLNATDINKIFDSGIADTYTITTNGLFLSKGFHRTYHDKIHYILYHFAPEIHFDTEVLEYETFGIPMSYTFVLHEDNICAVERLLTRYEHIDFTIHMLQPRIEGLDISTQTSFYRDVYDIVKDCDNVQQQFKSRLRKIISYIDDNNVMNVKRKLCASVYNQISVNLDSDTIHRCCVSMGSCAIPLTEDNLIKTIKNQRVFPDKEPVCEKCIANFIWDDNKIKKMMEFVR